MQNLKITIKDLLIISRMVENTKAEGRGGSRISIGQGLQVLGVPFWLLKGHGCDERYCTIRRITKCWYQHGCWFIYFSVWPRPAPLKSWIRHLLQCCAPPLPNLVTSKVPLSDYFHTIWMCRTAHVICVDSGNVFVWRPFLTWPWYLLSAYKTNTSMLRFLCQGKPFSNVWIRSCH